MGLQIFGKKTTDTPAFGAALTALVGNKSATAEQVDAANLELDAAGIQGAQLVPGAVLDELTAKASRTDTAEAAVATAQKEATDTQAAEKTATDALAAEKARADKAEAEVERLGNQSGAITTTSHKAAGKNDVEEPGANDHQKTVDALHAKMLGEA